MAPYCACTSQFTLVASKETCHSHTSTSSSAGRGRGGGIGRLVVWKPRLVATPALPSRGVVVAIVLGGGSRCSS